MKALLNLLNIFSFIIDIFKKAKEKKIEFKDEKEQAELEDILNKHN